MVTLTVDDQAIQAPAGSSVLSACLASGIYIPHLCWLEGDAPDGAPAACRLCFVQVDGMDRPVTACTLGVKDGLRVRTATPAVRSLQKTALKLLLSVHRVDCKSCPADKACALQKIARFLKIGLNCKPFERLLKEPEIDSRHPVFDYYPNRCVLCGICVRICRQRAARPLLSFIGRGFDTMVGYIDEPPEVAAACIICHACVAACPTGALVEKKAAAG